MERKIGEIFEYNGEWYQCVEGMGCENCAFKGRKCYLEGGTDDPIGECCYDRRRDNKDVIFKKLEKVGEPFERNGYMYQAYKTHTYPLLMSGDAKIPTPDGFAVIIKQNKEGNNPNLSNTEKIGKNLKPFDLEAAKSGKPVGTRDGRKARIICFDKITRKNYEEFKIIALVRDKDNEDIHVYNNEGRKYLDDSSVDLMMLPEKKSGWINIYPQINIAHMAETSEGVYPTEAEAKLYAQADCIATVPIEWEE